MSNKDFSKEDIERCHWSELHNKNLKICVYEDSEGIAVFGTEESTNKTYILAMELKEIKNVIDCTENSYGKN